VVTINKIIKINKSDFNSDEIIINIYKLVDNIEYDENNYRDVNLFTKNNLRDSIQCTDYGNKTINHLLFCNKAKNARKNE